MQIAKQYEAGGAACLSVLTDKRFFQGSFDFLQEIRASGVECPLLCKEFIVEAYQLYKARACVLCHSQPGWHLSAVHQLQQAPVHLQKELLTFSCYQLDL